jgi:formylglycine-generating enzyme required for sulfatase activity
MEPIAHLLKTGLLATFTAGVLLGATEGRANNIAIANAALTNNDGSLGICQVQFDLSWENSWRGGGVTNWDAAWVFVKFRTTTSEWQHVLLNNTGHSAPSGSQIDLGLLTPGSAYNATTNPVIGVFVRRSGDGTGTFAATGTQLRWNYGALNLFFNDIAEVRVYAVEMVHVNQAAFHVGLGIVTGGAFTDGAGAGGSQIPFPITSEGALTMGPTAGSLWGTSTSGLSTIGDPGTLPAAYPKGFRAFYCMKYEITQQQYVDFLNSLNRSQQNARTGTALQSGLTSVTQRYVMSATATPSARNGIACSSTVPASTPITFQCDLNGNGIGGEANDGLWTACNHLSWSDVAAYLDWSGLRPLTELEYEKACRGPVAPPSPVIADLPWGPQTVSSAAYTLVNAGTANEQIATNYSTTVGNALYTITSTILAGPARVGIFAGNTQNSGRVTAGASLYGIMELAGNVNERTVTVGNTLGRAYTGLHGNGQLNASGTYDVANWPSALGEGAGQRGGSWESQGLNMLSSDRITATQFYPFLTTRLSNDGGRGVRTAP